MANKIQLTKREEELMNFMWEYGRPVTSKDIHAIYTEHTWSATYLLVMLKSLEKKGVIEQCGFVQYGTQYARQFRVCLTKEDYYIQLAMGHGVRQAELLNIAMAAAKQVKPEEKDALIHTLESFINDLENRGEE